MDQLKLNPVELAIIKTCKKREGLKKINPSLYFKLLMANKLDEHYPIVKETLLARRARMQRYSYGNRTCSEIVMEILRAQDGGELSFNDVFKMVKDRHPRALDQSIRGSLGHLLMSGEVRYIKDRRLASSEWLAANPQPSFSNAESCSQQSQQTV
jgi:hypothetical protein